MTEIRDRGAQLEAGQSAVSHRGPGAERWHSALERYVVALASPMTPQKQARPDRLVVERLADLCVADVMSTPAVSVAPSAPFKRIVEQLARHRISAVPVVADSGEVVGLVSETDLLAHVVEAEGHPYRFGSKAEQRAKAAGETAADLMTSPAVLVRSDLPLLEAAKTSARKRLRRMPVVDRSGHLVGIITRSDFLSVFLTEDERLRRHVAERVLKLRFPADARSVAVVVVDGVATLSGKVVLKTTAAAMVSAVRQVAGVVAVHDDIGWQVDDSLLPAPKKRP